MYPTLDSPVTPTPSLSPLSRLQPIAAGHPAARRYSQARRNLLARHERVIAVHGRWAHEQLLLAQAPVEHTLWCPGDTSSPDADLVAAVVESASQAFTISERTLSRLHPGLSAPALLSVVRLPRWRPSQVLRPAARLVLVADGIEYAGNLGTLVRTADACGADGVVLTSMNARLSHPKVFVASRGTVLTMPVLEYTDPADARRDLAAAGFTSYVADPGAALSYRDVDFAAGRAAVVVGSEGEGVGPAWRTSDLSRVSIPMLGRADSLNVAASAAILLFEARAQLDG
jgi:TrmH family RNA methyltransferase